MQQNRPGVMLPGAGSGGQNGYNQKVNNSYNSVEMTSTSMIDNNRQPGPLKPRKNDEEEGGSTCCKIYCCCCCCTFTLLLAAVVVLLWLFF